MATRLINFSELNNRGWLCLQPQVAYYTIGARWFFLDRFKGVAAAGLVNPF